MTYRAKKSNTLITLAVLLSTTVSYSMSFRSFYQSRLVRAIPLGAAAMMVSEGMKRGDIRMSKWGKSKSVGRYASLKKHVKKIAPIVNKMLDACMIVPAVALSLTDLKYKLSLPIPNYLNDFVSLQCTQCRADIQHTARCSQCFPSQTS